MQIELRLARGATRRWHDTLRRKLRAAGHRVQIRLAASAPPSPAGLDLLIRFERMIYGHAGNGGGGGDSFAIAPDAEEENVDLVVDLAGEGDSPDEATTLAALWHGQVGEQGAIAAILDGKSPHIAVARRAPGGAAPRVVAEGRPGLEEPEVFTASFDRACARMGEMILLAVRRLEKGESGGPAALGERARPVSPLSVPRFGVVGVAGKIAARLTRLARGAPRWRVGWRRAGADLVIDNLRWPAGGYEVFPEDGRRYFADPFVFRHKGETFVFCEEYPFATGRGILSVFTVSASGAGAARPVLDLPYHLSYPQVFEDDGAIYMLPETGGNRTIELWRAASFPDRWEKVAVLVDNVVASDATLARHGGLYWIFATVAEAGESTWDALCLFYAEKLTGPWRAHPVNPVLIDAECARPAGLTVTRGGKLVRPAQNCVAAYGGGLAICQVDRLDVEGFAQTTLAEFAPPTGLRATGVHTLNAAAGVETIDFFGLAPEPRRAGH